MKRVFVAVLMVVAFAQVAEAQSVINNESLTRQKRTISVSFDIDSEKSDVSGMLKEVITPYIYNGADTLWLAPVEVYGKGRFKRERQENHINGNKSWALGDNQTMKGNTFKYNYEGSVEPWMAEAKLNIKREIIGCSKCEVVERNERVAEAELYVIPEYVLDKKADRRWDFGQDDLTVTFKVSKIDIDHTLFDNEQTFRMILAAVDKVHSNPHYRIDKIQVSGFASPEGSVKFNVWLGENRAKALIDYIIEQRPDYGLTYDNFEIVNGEENWSALRKVLVNSTMANKEDVIAIIDDDQIERHEKKSQIRAMDAGRTWSRMLREIYPHLRSARYLALYYDSTGDDEVDQIHKANELINEGKHAEAYQMAIKLKDDERAFNTIGVSLMAQGKFDEAVVWFEKAKDKSEAALKNYQTIEAEYGIEKK